MRAIQRPAVLHPATLPGFLQHLVNHHHSAPSTIIICSSRDAFEQHLLHALEEAHNSKLSAHGQALTDDAQGEGLQQGAPPSPAPTTHDLLMPTINNLYTTSAIRLTFCASLESLRAHLSLLTTSTAQPAAALLSQGDHGHDTASYPILALLNPLTLHKETTSFSAQGLSRTLAIAVEAAMHKKQKLVVAECPVPPSLRRQNAWASGDEEAFGAEDAGDLRGEGMLGEVGGLRERETAAGSDGDVAMGGLAAEEDPWAEQLSILNVTTKSFGIGERGWAGRTVSARKVAERWCRFEHLATR